MKDPARWQQIEDLFHAALEHASEKRADFLAEACGRDAVLCSEVISLLTAHEEAKVSTLELPAQLVGQGAQELVREKQASLTEGQMFSHYRIHSLLGRGGMGEVYLAEDSLLGRSVAIKLLPAAFTNDAERLRRFEREARATAALNHPNIVTIYEIGQHEHFHFIVMEFVPGQTLRQRIAAVALTTSIALDFALQIADALQAAHAAGVIHRDLKPENVMVRPDGRIKVLDFGLASLERPLLAPTDNQSSTQLLVATNSGVVMGTPQYMSPEQARGQRMDARTDIFSLGIMLYEMFAGQAPFIGATPNDAMAALLTLDPPPLTNSPPALQHIISKTLRKDRDERYQTSNDLLLDLKKLKQEVEAEMNERAKNDGETIAGSGTDITAEIKPPQMTSPAQVITATIKRQARAMFMSLALLLVVVAVVLLALPLFRTTPSVSVIARANWRLSSGNGMALGTIWSPDGKFIASTTNQSGNCDIWLYPLDNSGEPIQVTKDAGNEFVNDWSPDGRKLLFTPSTIHSFSGGFFVMPAFGGPAQKLTSFGVSPSWSPDGSKILFQSHWQISYPILARIYLINSDGTQLQEFRPEFTHQFITILKTNWHPDGKRITLLGNHLKFGLGLWTIPLDGGLPIKSEREPVVERRMNDLFTSYVSFDWGPSGEYLYLTAKSKGPWNVWRVKVDPQTLRWIDGPERLTASKHEDWAYTLSPDGKRMGYSMYGGFERTWTMPFEAVTGKLKGEEKLISPESGAAFRFDLSADGRELAYDYHPGAWDELHEYSFKTSRAKMLEKFDKYSYAIGAWSADGSRLAVRRFVRINPGNNRSPEAQYVWMPAGGGEALPITSPVDPQQAPGRCTDWSRDDQWLLEISNSREEGKALIRRLPLAAAPQAETQAQVVTTSVDRFIENARFSPDSRWVAFNSWRPVDGKEGTIYVVPVGGGDWVPITDSQEWVWNDRPRWSPDGKIIYYIAAGAMGTNVWGRKFDPVRGQPVGAAFQITKHFDPCKTGRIILVRNSGFGVARDRLVLPLISLNDISTWIMEDVDK